MKKTGLHQTGEKYKKITRESISGHFNYSVRLFILF